MYKLVIVCLVSVLLCDASVVKAPCNTNGVKEGLCVKLRDCPSIWTMSNDYETPMTIQRLNYLIESLCGYEDKSPMVCCPLQEITISNLIVESTTLNEYSEESTTSSDIREQTINSNEVR